MAEVTNLSSSAQNVAQNETFTLTASVLGGPDIIRFEIPSGVPVLFTNNNSKYIEKNAPAAGYQRVPVTVSLTGQSGHFDIRAFSVQNPSNKKPVAMHLT